jgi:hypothetical protein
MDGHTAVGDLCAQLAGPPIVCSGPSVGGPAETGLYTKSARLVSRKVAWDWVKGLICTVGQILVVQIKASMGEEGGVYSVLVGK